MSDFTEMMLYGTLCEGCGEYLGEAEGYAMRCASCAEPEQRHYPPVKHTKVVCPQCGKRVKKAGLAMHIEAKHLTEQV